MVINNEDLLLDNLKYKFRRYLESNYSHVKNIAIVQSDAFYVYRHNIGISFWKSMENEDTMENCREKLEEYFSSVRNVKTPRSNSFSYLSSMKILKEMIDKEYGGIDKFLEKEGIVFDKDIYKENSKISAFINDNVALDIPSPCKKQVTKYLNKWESLESYKYQESALKKLFIKTYPDNIEIDDVLIKVSSLNDFYSTNIFSAFTVAKHVVSLKVDDRIKSGDLTIVNDIALVTMENGNKKNFYSFATKYCSHHCPEKFPIYDSYVDRVLRHFRNSDKFYDFKNIELRDYEKFKNILMEFRKFYELESYSLKDIDKYLWLLGKEEFPNKY